MLIKVLLNWFKQTEKATDFYVQKKLIELRRRINHLYFEDGWSKNRITRKLGVSKHFVIKWTQSPEQDVTIDRRGWPKGQRRKWDETTEKRIRFLHGKLVADPTEFFTGATAIAHLWRQEYSDSPPPLRTIGQIKKDLKLIDNRPQGRVKGAAKYLRYPETTVYGGCLGNRVMEADFIQRRYLKGQSAPLHFVGFSAKKSPKIRYYKRIDALTTKNFIESCDAFFTQFEAPDVLKLDNAATFSGSQSGKRSLSQTMIYLLNRKITPVFAVPKRPFTQASIEGNNSVFARYFWNKRTFADIADVDTQLEWFNAASLRYTDYVKPEKAKSKKTFKPKIYFLRQIHESQTTPGQGFITVTNEEILVPAVWINFFVLAEWNLETEMLTVFIEQEKKLTQLAQIDFTINETTRKNLNTRGALSFCI